MRLAAAHWQPRQLALVLAGLGILVSLILPLPVDADSRVRLQATIEPAYPIASEEFRLRVQASDATGRPLNRARVIAKAWMDPRQNPSMAAMPQGDGSENAFRLIGRPQSTGGEYLLTAKLPMTGRWRSQIWVESSGATGSILLTFDLLDEPPPTATNWFLLIPSWLIVAFGVLLTWWRALTSRRFGKPADLLKLAPLRSFLRSRWYPAVLQWPTLVAFALVTYLLLAGATEAHDNFGSAVTWVFWWPLLPLVFLLFGRLWCAVCPMSLLSDLSQRFFGRRLSVPGALKRRGPWLMLGAFLFITWADLVLGLVEVPSHTAYLLLAVTAGVVFCGLLFERRTWCRYLCPIGGLSGNYAMAAALELRAEDGVCRHCRRLACVRGSGDTPGCPMFEFPRTMASNHHCNLCGNCLKTCPSDALRLTPRPPADELGLSRRGRWEEAILAATLLGAVALQSVVMLGSTVPTLGTWLGSGHGGGNPVALTALFVVVTGLPLGALALAGLLSAAAAREDVRDNVMRFAYALIPLGLAGHLAHNMNHLLSEGRSLANTASRLLGTPTYAAAALESPSTVRWLQYALIAGGALISLAIASRLAYSPSLPTIEKESYLRRLWAGLPHQALIAVLAAGLLLLFAQDMVPRLQLSAEAHDQISPAQITAAKASVVTFLGRSIPLEFVHLEEHGYRDIILRNGETYYFVDAWNMQVASMFSSSYRPSAASPLNKARAQRTALEFALQHYPNFSRYNLQPAYGPEEASPYSGGYVFEWRQYVNGVTGPNYVKVTTDGIGAVAIYSARDVPVTAPTEPLVNREQATAIAKREVTFAPQQVTVTLDIGPEMTGRQALRWTISLRDDRGGGLRWAEVVVDARSGEVLSLVDWS